ncbi:hypothetical protein [Nocardiopsis sp. NPDC057823]|uniref:hypothetical protein n=1 Tax=Nocardiopsis sp. NPDC057823 TaxID=3346256 RepID=UPI00366C4BE3
MSDSDWAGASDEDFAAMMRAWAQREAAEHARALPRKRLTSTAFRHDLRRAERGECPHALIGSTRYRLEELVRAAGHDHLAEAALAVLDLHSPTESGQCSGCRTPQSGQAYLWPCPTTQLLFLQIPGGEAVDIHAAELREEPW